jgi:flagellar assembly protein FliH
MSSKLLRGRPEAAEPVAWTHVPGFDFPAGEPLPAGPLTQPRAYVPPPGATPADKEAAKAAAELEQRVIAAHQKGFEEGQAAAHRALAPEVEAMRAKLARAIEELTGLRARSRREAEQDVVALALAVARRILHRELTVAPEALLGLVKAALDKMESREIHRVRVARSDAAAVRKFFERMGPSQRVEVLADPALAPGSVRIESGGGTLDASADTQLDEIERGFADLVRGAS